MKKLVIGGHTGSRLAMLDMSGRFKPKVWGGLFRMGDRAAAHVWVAEWRKRHAGDRILIIDDPFKEGSGDSIQLDAKWLFNGIADEIWLTERKDEHIANPGAYQLYHTNLWRIWYWLRYNKTVIPTIEPKPAGLERARQLLAHYKVPERFVTFQPLFDAPYNKIRNAPIVWWRAVAEKLREVAPLVMIGSYAVGQQFRQMDGVYPLWDAKLSPMDSLALIRLGATHVGGETGMTLWASMFRRPTVAVYARWSSSSGKYPMDCRPLSFGAPVVHAQLSGDAAGVAEKVKQLAC